MIKDKTFLLRRALVDKFVKSESANWPREMKIAKHLVMMYPLPDMWLGLELGFKLNSLAWFLTEKGKQRLEQEATH